jgi:hypothetical protein
LQLAQPSRARLAHNPKAFNEAEPWKLVLAVRADIRGNAGSAQALKRIIQAPISVAARLAVRPYQQIMRVEVQGLSLVS